MTKRVHRPQKSEIVSPDDGEKPVVVAPHPGLDDRMHNPKDVDPDRQAMANGMEHGGTMVSRAESLHTRGEGGRKRSGPRSKGMPGRDISKRR